MAGEDDPDFRAFYEAEYTFKLADAQNRLDYADGYGQSALKSAFLVNGGAIVALLTFVGNVESTVDIEGLFWAFVSFIAGLIASLLGYLGAYFSQNYFYLAMLDEARLSKAKALNLHLKAEAAKETRSGNCWLGVAIAGAILSVISFGCGSIMALQSIT